MIPTFDPQAKTQTMKDWLKKINETASVYGWNEKQITFYALPRLVGLAKRWYDGLTTVKYNWKQWQVKLLKAFPCEENYGDLLTEMLVRKSLRNETLEEYYYDKIRLINRCSIVGSKAVDCLTHGIYDNHIRMNVQGLSFKDPENVLNYFRKISSKNGNVMNFRKLLPSIEHPSAQSKDNTIKQKGSTTRCHNCKEIGHFWTSCKKDLVKCNICNRVGHEHQQCFRSKGFRNDKGQGSSHITKNVMQIKTNNSGSSKYYKDVSVNGIATKAFIDFGSECTLISDQLQGMILNAFSKIHTDELPVLKGFANGVIRPTARIQITIEIDSVKEIINAYVIPQLLLPTGVNILIGQNLTELPQIRVFKSDTKLCLYNVPNLEPLKLSIVENAEINGVTTVKATTKSFTGYIYISTVPCLKPGLEYLILPGIYFCDKGCINLFVIPLTSEKITLLRNRVVARGKEIPNVFMTDFSDKDKVEPQRKLPINVYSIVIETIHESESIQYTDINIDVNLDPQIKKQLYEMLNSNKQCFAFSNAELGETKETEMQIRLKDDVPVCYRPYRLSYTERQKVKDMIDDLQKNGIIRESESEYSSPIIVVPKKNGELRLCVDFRALNKKTHKDKYPMPLIEDQINSLSGQSFYTTLDLASGYHQIPIAENCKHITAFVTPDGHFEYNRMPFGLCNAPAVFQRLINKVLSRKKIPGVVAYMDDIIISSKTVKEGIDKLQQVLEMLKEANLTLNLAKCHFFKTTIEYLGYEISSEGVRPGLKKTEAVESFKRPQNPHEIRQFVGLASFFRRFVPRFAILAQPLTCLTKTNAQWIWGEPQEEAFSNIKRILVSRPVLAIYNPSYLTELHTDASQVGIGGILLQRPNKELPLRAVAYFSWQTTAEEQHFHSYELETLAIGSQDWLETIQTTDPTLNYIKSVLCNTCPEAKAIKNDFVLKDEFERFAREAEIKHIKNAVAMPRANGQIERYNRSVLSALSALTNGDDDRNWDTHLNTVQWSLNNTLNKGIGKTPAEVIFHKPTINISESHLHDMIEENSGVADEGVSDIHAKVMQTIKKNQANMTERFNKKRCDPKIYQEGIIDVMIMDIN
ncbi:uncharacterized protein [Maniola hyperantus]|uniref:uncharacterized protein n=1 Tax=Aphantopus hyperantus TaxID=2795564 RepID=UPI0037489742